MRRLAIIAALIFAAPLSLDGAQWIVPAAAHAAGAQGTSWRTDLRIYNRSATTATANVVFLPANTDNSVPPRPVQVTIPGGGERTITDVLMTSFQHSGTGGLIVESPSSSLVVTSRTYNVSSTGTFGQSLPGVPVTDALGDRSTGYFYFVAKSDRFRTNVGFANASNQSGEVSLRLYSAGGNELGRSTVTLQPLGQTQVNDIFNAIGAPPTGIAHAEIVATVPVVAYASVIDNETGDPVAMLAERQAQTSTVNYIPAVARSAGAFKSTWRSEVRYFNPSTQSASVTLTLYPQGATPATPLTKVFSLGPGNTVTHDDIVSSQFGQAALNGGLKVESTQRIFVTSRTYNESNVGTFGQDIPSFTPSDALTADTPAVFSGLSDVRFRTNFGFMNVTDVPLDVILTMRNNSGTVLGQRIVHLEPTVMTQINDVFAFFSASGTPQATITAVTDSPTGRFIAYASVIDSGSGDPVFVGPAK